MVVAKLYTIQQTLLLSTFSHHCQLDQDIAIDAKEEDLTHLLVLLLNFVAELLLTLQYVTELHYPATDA